MGHVEPGNYRPAPGHVGRPVDAVVPPQVQGAVMKPARSRSGLVGLTVAGGTLAFLSLFLPAVIGGLVTGSWFGAWTAFFWAGLVRIGLLHHDALSDAEACARIVIAAAAPPAAPF